MVDPITMMFLFCILPPLLFPLISVLSTRNSDFTPNTRQTLYLRYGLILIPTVYILFGAFIVYTAFMYHNSNNLAMRFWMPAIAITAINVATFLASYFILKNRGSCFVPSSERMLKIAMAQMLLNIVILMLFANLVKSKSFLEVMAEKISLARGVSAKNDRKKAELIRKKLAALRQNVPDNATIIALTEDKSARVFSKRIDVYFVRNPEKAGSHVYNELQDIQKIASTAGKNWIRYKT